MSELVERKVKKAKKESSEFKDLKAAILTDYDGQKTTEYDKCVGQDWRDIENYTLLQTIGDISGQKVLDIACGNGRVTRLMAEKGAHVSGIDFSETMIADAKSIETKKTEKIPYSVGDIFELGKIGDGNFDLITAVFALHYAPSEQHLLQCLKDVFNNLKTGGRFVSLAGHMDKYASLSSAEEGNRHYALVGFKIIHPVWPPVAWTPIQYRIFDGDPDKSSSKELFHLSCSYVPISVYEKLLGEAGFSSVKFLPWTYKGKDKLTNPYFEEVIKIEPHICLVAEK